MRARRSRFSGRRSHGVAGWNTHLRKARVLHTTPRTPTRSDVMDILDVITKDHDEAVRLVARIRRLSDRSDRSAQVAGLMQGLAQSLRVHALAEAETLHRACVGSTPRLEALCFQAAYEHEILNVMVAHLSELTPGDDGRLKAVLQVLERSVIQHARTHADGGFLPLVARAFS